jgi:hypothetical protein
MPTWKLTPINGTETKYEVSHYEADPKGNVLNFAIATTDGTGTYHLAPAHKQKEVNGIVSGGMDVVAGLAGAATGFKAAHEMASKLGSGGIGSVVQGVAGATMGAFLAHTAKEGLEKLYTGGDADEGDYYNPAGILRFKGPFKVGADGSLQAAKH